MHTFLGLSCTTYPKISFPSGHLEFCFPPVGAYAPVPIQVIKSLLARIHFSYDFYFAATTNLVRSYVSGAYEEISIHC